jgi:membrane protease YdiL (CAAX protease family)
LSSVAKDQQHSDSRVTTDTSDRQLAAWEIASIVSSILIAEWIAASVAGGSRLIVAIPITLAFAFMIISHRLRNETLHDLGFRFDNFLQSGLLLLLPMILVAIGSFALGRWFGGPTNFQRWHAGTPIIGQLALGFGWGLAQQYVLQSFINRRAQLVLGRGWLSVLLVAAVFSALHLPNVWLVVTTFAGGVVWATVYQRAPNLFALAVSHSLMTWVIVSTLPPSSLHHLRIGFKYFG